MKEQIYVFLACYGLMCIERLQCFISVHLPKFLEIRSRRQAKNKPKTSPPETPPGSQHEHLTRSHTKPLGEGNTAREKRTQSLLHRVATFYGKGPHQRTVLIPYPYWEKGTILYLSPSSLSVSSKGKARTKQKNSQGIQGKMFIML